VPTKFISFFLTFITLFITGCGVQEINKSPGTITPFLITGTPPPTFTPHPSETPLPPLPSPTIAPIEGIAATQLNVRAEPSTAGAVLGILPADTKVQIVGKDPGENWWQILYPQGEDGKGWVTAQYITTASMPEVPVIGGAGADPENANVAVIQQQLNVRSGPGTDFNSVGTLNAQDVANLTGKDSNGAWLQIEFAAGPEGQGWINAAFAQADGVENLPIVSESGTVVGTGTPVDTPQPPTPTVVPAPIDNDSVQAPAIDIVFSANGTRAIQYTSDLSAPTGDMDDWLRFTPFTRSVRIELTCIGNGLLGGEVLQNDQPIQNLACGANQTVTTDADAAYLLHLRVTTGADPGYVQYTLRIVSVP
jgi:uncharacterized protein YraI